MTGDRLRLKSLQATIAAVLLAGAASCGLLSSTLTGEVFIITGGHESIRLGLVTVSAFDRDVLCEHLRSRRAAWTAGPGQLIAQGREAVANRLEVVSRRYHEAQDPDLKAAIRLEIEDLTKRSAELYEKSPTDPPLDFYFEGIPKALSSATTNADGGFKLKVPGGRQVLICAIASRQTLGGRETYAWACPPPSGDRTGFHLSNDNMLGDEELAHLLRARTKKP